MTSAATIGRESGIDKIFGAVVKPQTYRNMLYLLLSYPLGLAYFIVLVVGFSLGVGMLIIFVGLPILLAVFALSRGFLHLERWLASALLGAHIPERAPVPAPRGLIERGKAILRDPSTWRGLAYLLVRFPMGIISFVMFMVVVAPSLAMITAPLTYNIIQMNIGWSRVEDFDSAVFVCSIGAIWALLGIHVINAWTAMWRRLCEEML